MATKRTPFQREESLHRIASLYLQQWTQAQIGKELGLSQGMISNDLKLIQKRWREQTAFNLDEAKARELARLDTLEREYWATPEQSNMGAIFALIAFALLAALWWWG